MLKQILYKPINGFTREMIIARILTHFKGKSAMKKAGEENCQYRSEVNGETRSCVAGLFIPDKDYQPRMEGVSIGGVLDYFPKLGSVMPLPTEAMECLQMRHDNLKPDESVGAQRGSLIDWIIQNVEEVRKEK